MPLITSGKNIGDYVTLLAAQAITAATSGGTNSSWLDARGDDEDANARDISFLFRSNDPVEAGESVTLQLEQATSIAGADVKPLNEPVVVTVDGEVGLSPPLEDVLQASIGLALADLDHANGFYFVRVNLVGSTSTAGQLAVIGHNQRFNP